MRMNYIELKGFKRFALNNINYFKYSPHERHQLILGTNGSGKSSLLGEMSPLPADPRNYTKDGYKKISYTHQGRDYLLISSFEGGASHSFIVDGVEKNTGGTVTAQKELVFEHFNYDQQVQDLVSGLERFTKLKPTARREWFTRLCDVNYDYALLVYGRAKERHRDTSGALKLAKKRLVIETAKIATKEEIEKLNSDINKLTHEITLLYELRVDVERSVPELQKRQLLLEGEIEGMSRRLMHLHSGSIGAWLKLDAVKVQLDEYKQELTWVQARTDRAVQEFNVLKEKHEAHMRTSAQSLDELKDRLKSLQELRNTHLSNRRLELEGFHPSSASVALNSIMEPLQELLTVIPENAERKYSQALLLEAQAKYESVNNQIYQGNRKLEDAKHRKLHLDEAIKGGESECPKCSHRWLPGFNKLVYDELGATIAELVEKIPELEKQKEELVKVIQENTAYGNHFREFTRMTRNVTALAPFWDYLIQGEYVQNSPRFALAQLGVLRHDLDLELKAEQTDVEIARVKELIELSMKTSDTDIGQVTRRMEELDAEITKNTVTQYRLTQKIAEENKAIARVQEFITLNEKIQAYVKLLNEGVDELVKATRNEIIYECLKEHQIELGQKQSRLSELLMQRGIVEDLERSVERMAKEEQVAKQLAESMSPSDGLIAEGLYGFIKNFTRKMNAIIRKIWTYKLEILDTEFDSEGGTELSYKFPTLVGSESNKIPDVSDGSTGQQEVINLAYKIIAMGNLGLGEAPLLLDEFAASFDDAHKVSGMNAVRMFMEQLPFSQLFLVSHFEDHYGVFHNAEVCVLDKENIVLPTRDKYNTHVEIA